MSPISVQMFSKKNKKSSNTSESEALRELRALLREAIDRNATIGIVRLGYSGQDPLAQGRLISWDEEGIVIEQLQVIGRDVRFTVDTRIEAFVKYKDITIVFECKVVSTNRTSKLNDTQIVQSLRISHPHLLRKGDRRSAFRSNVTANGDEIPVKMWFIDRVEDGPLDHAPNRSYAQIYYTDLLAARRSHVVVPLDEDGKELRSFDWDPIIEEVQLDKPHAIGRLTDLTANGLGILMYGIVKMQLNRFERIVVQFELEDQEISLVVEVRHGMDLRGSTCKLGSLIVHPNVSNMHAQQRRVLETVAMRVQREQLKHRRSA
jgi:hypothetical protein